MQNSHSQIPIKGLPPTTYNLQPELGFSLVELLVIVTLIVLVSLIVVILIDPGETVRKSRNARRITDLSHLQVAIEHYISDNGGIPPDLDLKLRTSTQSSSGAVPANASGSGWIPVNLTKYIEKLPIDPLNTGVNIYRYYRSGRFYKLDAVMESVPGFDVMSNTKDGGNDACHYEVGSGYDTITLAGSC